MVNINTLILKALENGSLYGLEIINYIFDETNGKLHIKQPSLYSALRRFENRGFVTSYWEDSDIGGRRHYYTITDDGREYLKSVLQDVDLSETFGEKKENNTKSTENTSNFAQKNKNFDKIFADDDSSDDGIEEKNHLKNTILDTEKSSDISYKNEDTLDEKTENTKFSKDNIDYKGILGDLFVAENLTEKNDIETKENEPSKIIKPAKNIFSSETSNDSTVSNSPSQKSKYYDEIKSIIAGNTESEKTTSPSLEDTTTRLASLPKSSCKVVEELERHYKQKKQNEKVFSTTEHYGKIDKKSLKRNSYKSSAINKTEPRVYLNVNRLRFTRSIFMSLIMLLEIALYFLIYHFILNYPLDMINYIISACFGATVLIYFLTILIMFRNFPDKKLKNRPTLLLLNFIKRFMIIVLLLAVVLASYLMCGISFEQLIAPMYISYWILPVTFIADILIAFVLNIILYSIPKFYR